ncbi:hypothetical protein BGX24_006294 [Mortierella sp. AD032]|nr:hypothetical protein BGX24_006294 [Mortierella sp. AD032]
MGVCGFHMHTSTWEKFKLQLLQAESMTAGGGGPLGRSQGSEREKVFAEGHHQLALRHTCLHDGFIQLARVDGCKAQMTTVAQWIAWEQEIVSCSAKWAVRKNPIPGHILSSKARLCSAKVQPRRDDSGQLTYVENGLAVFRQTAKDNGNSQETLPTAALASALASALDHKPQTNDDPSRESRQDSGIEVDENDPEGDDENDGSEPDWSQSTTWCLNASPYHRMRPLSLSTNLLRKCDWSGDLKARRWIEPQEGGRNDAYNHGNEECDYSHQDHQRRIYDNNGETDLSMRPMADVRSLSVSQMRGMYLSLETPKEYGTLIQRLHGSKLLAAERERGTKAVQGSETRLRDWEDSIERLGEYVKELCQDGLDSSTLLCRSCGNGTLLHANVPCYHLVMCDDCIKEYRRCVVCSTKIESSQRIYW